MKYGHLPVALIEAWIFIETSDNEELKHSKYSAHTAIKNHFGSVEIAQIYVDECRSGDETIEFS
jgi:hypothetical protein